MCPLCVICLDHVKEKRPNNLVRTTKMLKSHQTDQHTKATQLILKNEFVKMWIPNF